MSLFGQAGGSSAFGQAQNNSNQQQSSSPFGSTAFQLKPANTFASSQPGQQQGAGLFGSNNTGVSAFGAPTQNANTTPFEAPAQNQTQPGGIFGSNANSSTPRATPFSLGNTQPQQSGGSLFGTNNAPQPLQQNGGLFGSGFANSTAQQTQQSGSLSIFPNAMPTPQISPLVGAPANTAPQGIFGQQPANSLFGATSQPSTQAGGIFGASKPAASLFGTNASQAQQQAPKPSLFGTSTLGASTQLQASQQQQQQQQQPQRTSLFGAANATSGSMLGGSLMGGGLTMGQGNAPQQQTVPGVKIDVSNMRGTTRFNDLHEELQKQIEQIDAFIQQQINFKEQCDALMPAHERNLLSIPADVDFIRSKLDTVELALDNDSSAINTLKGVVHKDAENARVSFRTVENLKLPQQFHYTGMWQGASSAAARHADGTHAVGGGAAGAGPASLVSFFSESADEMSKTLGAYRQNIGEIEAHLHTVETSTVVQAQQAMLQRGKDGGRRSRADGMRELIAVLKQFEAGIVAVAGRVGGAREEVEQLIVETQAQGSRARAGRY